MTLASCAPEGQPPPFKIAVPEQRHAAATGLGSRGLSGPRSLQVPFVAPPTLHALLPAPHLPAVAFQSNSLGPHRAGARDRKQRPRTNEPAAPAQPPTHAPHPVPALKDWVPERAGCPSASRVARSASPLPHPLPHTVEVAPNPSRLAEREARGSGRGRKCRTS